MGMTTTDRSVKLAKLWAKTSPEGSYHPLILHLLDVAACADAILEREPLATRERFAQILKLEWIHARPWILTIAACHDLGKACPGFQCKWTGSRTLLAESDLTVPTLPKTDINHAYVSQIALAAILAERGWPIEFAEQVAAAAQGGPFRPDFLVGVAAG